MIDQQIKASELKVKLGIAENLRTYQPIIRRPKHDTRTFHAEPFEPPASAKWDKHMHSLNLFIRQSEWQMAFANEYTTTWIELALAFVASGGTLPTHECRDKQRVTLKMLKSDIIRATKVVMRDASTDTWS